MHSKQDKPGRYIAMVMPVEGPAIFVGKFLDACEHVWALPDGERARITIWTKESTYAAAEIETLRECWDGISARSYA